LGKAIFMAEARVERRLVAILAADVAGYSRLMGNDEEGTLAALKACRRELIDPKIAEHRGRWSTGGVGAQIRYMDASIICSRSMAPGRAKPPDF
jgi:adenylate cyclase